MTILMDTHTMLWLFNDDEKLSQKIKNAIEEPQNSVFVSIVSFWEIAI
ncbi:MAG: PIN domain-containing protein [Desulfamplus sp.]|nr:PIN domain-containing protein [Desulfamplus sp.]